jgi:hypothetical protein
MEESTLYTTISCQKAQVVPNVLGFADPPMLRCWPLADSRRMFLESRRMFPESRRMFPESRRMFPEYRHTFPKSGRQLRERIQQKHPQALHNVSEYPPDEDEIP